MAVSIRELRDKVEREYLRDMNALDIVENLLNNYTAEGGEAQSAGTEENSGQKRGVGRPPKVRDPLGKECTKCGVWKAYAEFHTRRDASDHKSAHCKQCRNGYMRNRHTTSRAS